MTFTIPSPPPSALALVRLLLALPPHRHIRITWVDWEAGTFRYVL
jgi:hypothetical protein